MIALYDLFNRPASYDFVTFLATAKTMGADHVRFVVNRGFKKKDYTLDQAIERYKTIVKPAVGIWGLEFSEGERDGFEFSHMFPQAFEAHKENGIAKIPVKCEDKGYITITLRKSRNSARDSNDDEWRKFAGRCGRKAIILPDYDERPIDLADRMRLYAGAHMNLFVMNGPATLCIHSEAPYLIMRTIGCKDSGSTSPSFMRQIGIEVGFQFPWANARQRLSYAGDTCAEIERDYHAMEDQRMAA